MIDLKKWKLKSTLKEILIAAALLFILTNIISYIRKPELGSRQLPKIKAQLLDGSTFAWEEGKPLLLHYWAVWCPTCELEAPNVESVSKEYQVLTIAVNSGSDENVKAYMQENSLSFKVVNDIDGRWAKQFKVEAYPTTFIYDGKGELRFTEVGYTTTAGLLARLEWIE
jgi:thiol-disulfide isomerase/thioredoxin